MACSRRGRHDEAIEALARFRQVLQDQEYSPKEENKNFLTEAEGLIGVAKVPTPPSDKQSRHLLEALGRRRSCRSPDGRAHYLEFYGSGTIGVTVGI